MIVMIHRLRGRSPAVLVPWTPLFLSASHKAGALPTLRSGLYRAFRCARMAKDGRGTAVLVVLPTMDRLLNTLLTKALQVLVNGWGTLV